ncbi:hypothetical protein [Phytobacter ursingii]|uniref:Uncharacterized protein n=1 Tax=Phytobacter ursingii TaxID=1972431 RepID=A0AB35RJF2_9ENTR|nr:hypothetical protein [Phytobacter ursingii]MDV2862100.1 hypothetical protein [Phytobacter ursingii]
MITFSDINSITSLGVQGQTSASKFEGMRQLLINAAVRYVSTSSDAHNFKATL